MKPIFDADGSVVAWLSCDSVLDMDGHMVAFIYESIVYSCGGIAIGYFEDGYFWKRDGMAVAFIESATPGSHQVTVAPFSPSADIGVAPPVPRDEAAMSARTPAWSKTRWTAYVRGSAMGEGIDR